MTLITTNALLAYYVRLEHIDNVRYFLERSMRLSFSLFKINELFRILFNACRKKIGSSRK